MYPNIYRIPNYTSTFPFLWIFKYRCLWTSSIFINNSKEDAKCPVVERKSSRNLHSHSPRRISCISSRISPICNWDFFHLQFVFLAASHLGFVPIWYLWAQIRQFVLGHSSRGLTVWLLCTNASPPGPAPHCTVTTHHCTIAALKFNGLRCQFSTFKLKWTAHWRPLHIIQDDKSRVSSPH